MNPLLTRWKLSSLKIDTEVYSPKDVKSIWQLQVFIIIIKIMTHLIPTIEAEVIPMDNHQNNAVENVYIAKSHWVSYVKPLKSL